MNTHQVTWQVILNFAIAHIIVWMRRSNWKGLQWIGEKAPEWTTQAAMLLFSFFSALALVWHYDPASGAFAISGSVTGIGLGVQHILQNYLGATGFLWAKNIYDAATTVLKTQAGGAPTARAPLPAPPAI